MKIYFVLFSITFLLVGCSNQDPKIELANKYWQALVDDDTELLKTIVETPNDENTQLMIKRGYSGDFPTILDINSNGVTVKIKRYCYPDLTTTTHINEVNGEFKVNHLDTMQSLFQVMRKAKTNKKFCYEFEDQPMQGKIDGKDWRPTHILEEPFLNSTVPTLYESECELDKFGFKNCSKIMLFRFNNGNDKSQSGNFGDYTNMTMYSPPSNNLIGLGSFKISQKTDVSYKLEITYKHDENNYISGFLVINTPK